MYYTLFDVSSFSNQIEIISSALSIVCICCILYIMTILREYDRNYKQEEEDQNQRQSGMIQEVKKEQHQDTNSDDERARTRKKYEIKD